MNDLVILANRLPVEAGDDGTLTRSPGGLVAALHSTAGPSTRWVGWAGSGARAGEQLADEPLLHTVPLSAEEVERYYAGFSNSVLWPLFHGRLRREDLRRSWWRSYRAVNERFAAAAARVTPLGGMVWVHDYHLLLAPGMLRTLRPDVRVGFFLHIPFPAAQMFASLPWRKELLEGIIGADVVGFQSQEDLDNFMAAAERVLGCTMRGQTLVHRHHAVHVAAFPISVDFAMWDVLGEQAAEAASRHRADLAVDHVFLGIDRLDYTKGILQRLRAFGELLDDGRLDAARTTFVQIAVPSRGDVPAYHQERQEVEAMVRHINITHERADGRGPVHYLATSLDPPEMAAWYRAADVLVVTSFADGMNLVAKEFVSARGDDGGVLILSEFAGAANEMGRALIVNPYDLEGLERSMLEAVRMTSDERSERMQSMRAWVESHDVQAWAASFLERLESVAWVRSIDAPRRSLTRALRGLPIGERGARW
ncbi:MAG: trehalose-6-phosphate synthase [Actinomycetota bacterium]|nr:trehalose-6-phosphate synthase [Actinomycetota bacterium]